MSAPDKIYLVHDQTTGCLFVNYDNNVPNNLEYVRKDTLLEWAKEELSHAIANIEAYPYEDAYRGHREKIEELIEKLESL